MRGLCILLLCAAMPALAVIETYEFESETTRARYQQFVEELRCPKCQNQNLEDSNAPIAADLRRELHRLLQDGYSDEEIVDFMVSRYGEFILYKPPVDENTAVLWVAPAVFLLVGAVVIVVLMLRRGAGAEPPGLSSDERERLSRLLDEDRDTK